MSYEGRPDTQPVTTEYGRGAFLMRRLLRPQTYYRAAHAALDRPKWSRIHDAVGAAAAQNPDFFVLQIGANDGQRADPVNKLLSSNDVQGLLVEPVPKYFDALRATYAAQQRLQFAKVAIAERDGSAVLHSVQAPVGATTRLQGSSSLNRKVIDSSAWVVPDVDKLIVPITVPTMRLQTLLDEYNVPRVDYCVVDTEGHDRVVVDQLLELPDPAHQPTFVLYEHMHLAGDDRHELETSLVSRGYELTTLRRDTFAQLQS